MIIRIGKYRVMIRFLKFELTNEMAQRMKLVSHSLELIKAMDNKELLHNLISIGIADNFDVLSHHDLLWAELEDRLFPEYDGDNVQYEPWGWKYKDGREIVYRYKFQLAQGEKT